MKLSTFQPFCFSALFAAFFMTATPGRAQTSVVATSDNRDYIDQLFEQVDRKASLPLTLSRSYTPDQFFAVANLGLDARSWAQPGELGGLFSYNKMPGVTIIDDMAFRLPTPDELGFLAPTMKSPEMDFAYEGKAMGCREQVKLGNEAVQVFTSDYTSRGKGVIYGLRFRLTDEYDSDTNTDHRYAFRYELKPNELVISFKHVGNDKSVKKVRDVNSEKWWDQQDGVKTIQLPLVASGTTHYMCTEGYCFTINERTLTLRPRNEERCCVRPYLDAQATYDEMSRFFATTAYGSGLYVDKVVNPALVTAASYQPTTVNLYIRCNPGSVTLKQQGEDATWCTAEPLTATEHGAEYAIKLKPNYSQKERMATFVVKPSSIDMRSTALTIRQPSLTIVQANGSSPIDFCAVSNVAASGGWQKPSNGPADGLRSPDQMAAKVNYNEALTLADVNDYRSYHLPTLLEMNCIFPDTDIPLTQPVDNDVNETISFGNSEGQAVTSSYFTGNRGTLYGLRFIGKPYCTAFRYRFLPGTGLEVSCLRVGQSIPEIKSAHDIAIDELYERNDARRFLFPATGTNFDDNEGTSGMLWTATPVSKEEVTAIYFDANGIQRMNVDPFNTYISVRPFIGQRTVNLLTE